MSESRKYSCGIDIGSRSTKVVILGDNNCVLGRGHHLTTGKPLVAASEALREAMLVARCKPDDLTLAATGYGRKLVPDVKLHYTSVTCHAAGAFMTFPETRNVLDIGALRSTAIRLNEDGRVHRFRLNGRCGAGVGRSLERMADTIEIPLEEIGQLALFSKNPQPIPSICSVLAETEILNHITHDVHPPDIIRGVCEALAERLATLLKGIWVPDGETTLTGGVAKNAGMVYALEDALKTNINIHHDSEFMGAIGAALLAGESLERESLDRKN